MRVTKNIEQAELREMVFNALPKPLQKEITDFDAKLAAVYFNLNGTVSVVMEDPTKYGA